MGQKIYYYDFQKKREVLVGEIEGTDFIKKVNRRKHFFRMYNGYAIQISIFRMLKEKRIKRIIFIEDRKTKLAHTIDYDRHYQEVNIRHGVQVVINVAQMEKI